MLQLKAIISEPLNKPNESIEKCVHQKGNIILLAIAMKDQ